MNNNTPAIAVIAYNRTVPLKRLLASLKKAYYRESGRVTLLISIDKSDNPEVLTLARSFDWPHGEKLIKTHEERLGLKNHVLECGDYSEAYGSVILLEDDLLVAPGFYDYAKKALDFSSSFENIGGISLYNHLFNVHEREPFLAVDDGFDNYYLKLASSWGQAYSASQWKGFREWLEKTDETVMKDPRIPKNVASWSERSWLKYNIAYLVKNDMYFLYPRTSLTTNFMSSGEHSEKETFDLQVPLGLYPEKDYRFSSIETSGAVYDAYFENERLIEYIRPFLDDGAFGSKDAPKAPSAFGNNDAPKAPSAFGNNDAPAAYSARDLAADLYGYRFGKNSKKEDDPLHYKYILSSSPLPYKVRASFGRTLRPADLNIINNTAGNDFFLYDTRVSSKPPKVDRGRIIMYNYRALNVKRLFSALVLKIKDKFR